MTGIVAPKAPTEIAIAMATMPMGRSRAISVQVNDTRPSEKPASSRWSSPPPSEIARIRAAMLGPAVAMTLRTRPVVVAMLTEVATMAAQITHENANVSAKNAPIPLVISPTLPPRLRVSVRLHDKATDAADRSAC